MCGRFYIDDDTAREIEKTVRKVDEQLRRGYKAGDIHPTEYAPVIKGDRKEMIATVKRWGFPGYGNQKVIINARAETVWEKNMFHDSILRRRLVIPAAGFYEWNKSKEKVTFTTERVNEKKSPILYLAGFYNHFKGEDRFIILTTAANASMQEVHDRMPVILEPEDLERWLWDDGCLKALLNKKPRKLIKRMEYEQQKLML